MDFHTFRRLRVTLNCTHMSTPRAHIHVNKRTPHIGSDSGMRAFLINSQKWGAECKGARLYTTVQKFGVT